MARFTLPRDLYHGKGALEALKTFERRTKEEQESGKVGQSGRGSGTGYKGIVFGRIKKAPKVS